MILTIGSLSSLNSYHCVVNIKLVVGVHFYQISGFIVI